MAKLIFVNLPVTDLPRARGFYAAIGGTLNPTFSDETAACMVFSDTIHAMLLTHDKFRSFSPLPIPDAHASAQVLLCLSAESRAAVDAVLASGEAAGGRADPTPAQDHGFMYGRSLADPDGHIWEFMWMDMSAMPGA